VDRKLPFFLIFFLFYPFITFSQNRAFFYDIKTNGIKINLIEDYRTLVSGFSLYYEGGSSLEPADKRGISNIIKYLMFSRTKNLSTDEFMFFFFNIGGITDSVLTKDYLLFYDVFPSFYLDSILWLELERINGLSFKIENFIRAKNLALKEYKTVSSKPLFNINNKISRLIYGETSGYGIPCVGRKKDILNITFKDIKQYYNKIMTPNRLSVFLTGAYSINEGFYKTRIFLDKVKPKKKYFNSAISKKNFKSGTYLIPYNGFHYYYVNVFNLGKPATIKEYLLFKLFSEIFKLSLKGYIIENLPSFSEFSSETIINKNGAYLKLILYSNHKIKLIKTIFLLDNIIKRLKKKAMSNEDFKTALYSFKAKLLDDFQYKKGKIKIFADIYNIFGKIYLEKTLLSIMNRITKYEIYRYSQKVFISRGKIEIKTK
jgi:predicted Zn-dependent peptidase